MLTCASAEKSPATKFEYTLEILKAYFTFSKPLENINELEHLIGQSKNYYLNKKVHDQDILTQLLLIETHLHIYQWKPKLAKRNLIQARLIIESLESKIYLVYYYNFKGALKFLKQSHKESRKYFSKALKILESIPNGIIQNKRLYVELNSSLFTAYYEINEIETAFKFYFKTIKFGKEYKVYNRLGKTLNSCALLCAYTNCFIYFKEAKQMLADIYKESNSLYVKECLAFIEILELDFKYDNDLTFYKELRKTLNKCKTILINASRKYFKGIYLIHEIKICLFNKENSTAFLYCNQLNALLLNCESPFNYNLLLSLSKLCIADEKYLKKISEMPSYKEYNIDYSIENLFSQLIKYTKKRRNTNRISVYNLIIDYYKDNLPNSTMQFNIFTDCISELQNICTDTSKFKIGNLTTKRQAEKQIHEKDGMLNAQKKMIQFFKEFAYTAAHDLKAPLSTITGFAEVIKKTFNKIPETETHNYLDNIISTGESLTEFIDELLNYEKNANIDCENLSTISLLETIEQVKINLNEQIKQSNCKILLLNMHATILARKRPIEILFQNLISNAIKYRKNNITPVVVIENDQTNNVFSFKDNGIGISQEMSKKVFKPFFRIPNAKVIGTGIGLATCKRIVESFGGEIWLESEMGEGTTFYFTLSVK